MKMVKHHISVINVIQDRFVIKTCSDANEYCLTFQGTYEDYPFALPVYHMNKKHWNSMILVGTIHDDEIENMTTSRYALCGND